MKYRVLQVSRVIVSVRESAEIVEDILRAGQPVGLDGEGVNLGPKGQLTLVQVSTVGGRVIIFDVQTTPAIMTQGGLQKLLESEHIIKVRPVSLYTLENYTFIQDTFEWTIKVLYILATCLQSLDDLKYKFYSYSVLQLEVIVYTKYIQQTTIRLKMQRIIK